MARIVTSTNTADLGTVVCNAFLRVVKQYKLYPIFQKMYFSRCAPNRPSSEDRIGGYNNMDELMEQVKHQAQREFESHSREGNDYERITFIINVLLRTFLERGGVSPQKLGMYGQEIFDLACYRLYGDQYLDDMNNLNHGAPRPTNEFESMLIGHYMNYIHEGGEASWEEWCHHHAREIDKLRRQHTPMMDMMVPEYDMDTDAADDDDDDHWPF